MPTNGNITVISSVGSTLPVPELRSGTMYDSIRQTYEYTDGVAAGQNDRVWSDQITLAAGAFTVLSLAPVAGAPVAVNGNNVFGVAVTFVRITSITIRNTETVAGTRILLFGPNNGGTPYLWLFAAANDGVFIPPRGVYCQTDDDGTVPIVVGVNDQLLLQNTDVGNAIVFDILITGRSA